MRLRVASILLLLAASGCSSFQGAPSRTIDADADLAAIESTMSSTAVAACFAGTGPSFASMEECRNRIVTARKYAIDVRFSEFEQDYFAQNRWTGFGATLATLGLSAAGSLSGTGAAQALAAAAAGVTGGRAAYEREVLGERTLLTIDAAMHAQRDIIALAIRDGLQKSAQDYSLGAALSDLDAYYRAGTVVGGLTTVTLTVGAQAAGAQAELRNVLPLTRTPASAYLLSRVHDGDGPLIRAQMRAAGISDQVTVARFVRTAPPARLEAVARALGWTPDATDPAATDLPGIGPPPRKRADPPPPRAPTRPAAQPGSTLHPSARQFLRDFEATPGNADRIQQAMRLLRPPSALTANQFIDTATRGQLEDVAKPLGWTP